MPEVRLIGADGKQIGIVKTPEALVYAQERDLDLVEVAPDARPPVCRVLDYSKYKYEQAQKQKAARRHQQQITVREIKFRPKIAQNDYDTKKGHVARFLRNRDKVKITIMFRGREVTHPERGTALLDRLAGELSELGVVEQSPVQDGRNMTMLLAPSKAVLAGEKDKAAEGHTEQGADGHQPESSDEGAPEAVAADATPADSTPADSTPAENAPADGTPADSTPAENAPADGSPADSTPADNAPADGTPADSTPNGASEAAGETAEDEVESAAEPSHPRGAAA